MQHTPLGHLGKTVLCIKARQGAPQILTLSE
jgi:hypothetical protein